MVRERGNMEDGWGGSRREWSDSDREEEKTNEVRIRREDANRTEKGGMSQRAMLWFVQQVVASPSSTVNR